MAYSWRPEEVLFLLGIPVPNRKEFEVPCPSCGSKRFAFNISKGIGHCWHCDAKFDSAGYYAAARGMSLREAREDIERNLGITHSSNGEFTPPPRIVYKEEPVQEIPLASSDVTDKTIRAFLEELTLSEKHKYHLLSRGMVESAIVASNYKSVPRYESVDSFALCKRLKESGCELKGVAGFFETKKGDATYVQLTSGILMPMVNYKNEYYGLQDRKDDEARTYINDELEAKCAYFSSKNRKNGTGAVAGVHYACDFIWDMSAGCYKPVHDGGFILTEGIMKADIAHAVSGLPIISVPGVNALNHLKIELERLKSMGVHTILLCYDMDYKTNPHVQKQLAKTEELIANCGLRLKKGDWESNVTVNGTQYNLNGLDDYLVFEKYGIVPRVKMK